jgi:similar to stage IV sporulation protein
MNRIYSSTSFTVNKKDVAKALNLIISNSLTYINAYFMDNGDLKIIILSSKVQAYKKIFYENSLDIKLEAEKGFAAKIKENKHRLGIVIGILIMLISVLISSKFVWQINVTGNNILSEDEVINELKDAGFYVGTYIPNVDYKDLHNKILLSSERISWISINITGNVANVSIKENLNKEKTTNTRYTNVISKYDGQIVSINVIDGEKQISVGDVVKKGDLLISGIIDSKSQGVRYVNANGVIKAYVSKNIQIKIPFTDTVKSYTGKTFNIKSLKIFNNLIKFSIKYRNYNTICDTIEKTEQITLFNNINLPIYIITEKQYEYEYIKKNYTKNQVVDLAFADLKKEMDIALANAELISKNIVTSYDSQYFYIDCILCCIEDICNTVEFEVQN